MPIRLNRGQIAGLGVLAVGIALFIWAYTLSGPCDLSAAGQDEARRDDVEDACEDREELRGYALDAGVVCVLLWLCLPAFSLDRPRQFYEHFPMLKGRLSSRFKRAMNAHRDADTEEDTSPPGDTRVHAQPGRAPHTHVEMDGEGDGQEHAFYDHDEHSRFRRGMGVGMSPVKGSYDSHAASIAE